jgi:4-hydroxy-3-polyprenylbenzoate decarboxylase
VTRLVVGVTGASGAPYAARLLHHLRGRTDVSVDVVLTRNARLVWNDEVGVEPESFGFRVWPPGDFTAPFASGSGGADALVVVPCTTGALARIATGQSSDLLARTAEVMLKERRRLVLVLREAPLSLMAARHVVALVEAGADVLPASPSFYTAPRDLHALLDTVAMRALDRAGVRLDLPRWTGALQRLRYDPAAP